MKFITLPPVTGAVHLRLTLSSSRQADSRPPDEAVPTDCAATRLDRRLFLSSFRVFLWHQRWLAPAWLQEISVRPLMLVILPEKWNFDGGADIIPRADALDAVLASGHGCSSLPPNVNSALRLSAPGAAGVIIPGASRAFRGNAWTN